MYQAAVQYVSDLFANRQMRQLQSRRRAQRAGGGSEEAAGGEGPRDRGWLIGFTLWWLLIGLGFKWYVLGTLYNRCKYML
jgi:hypothetical protein